MSKDYQAMSLEVADLIASELRHNPHSCLALPTGRTPIGCYELLADWSQSGELDWSQAKCFALDEYVDVEEGQSFAEFLNEHLYQYTNLPQSHRINPSSLADYDALIELVGGLDLIVVGIGTNGHIAFNEPGTPLLSWTHCTWLTESTRKANAPFFSSPGAVPRMAVTMGINTILNSRKLVLIASGEHKQEILTRALYGPITESVPASFLQKHQHMQVVTDFNYKPSP